MSRSSLLLVAPLLFLAGCSTISQKLRQQISKGQYGDAIEDGNEWLRDKGLKDPGSERTREVKLLVAEASLGKARKLDTVGAYQQFKIQFDRGPIFKPIRAQATDLEAKACFRDDVLPRPTINKHRRFRRQYPVSKLLEESRKREVPLGLARAERGGTVKSYRWFHRTYGHWPEAKAALVTAHTREAQLAFDAIKEIGSLESYRRFRERYRGWKEVSTLVASVRRMELTQAYEATKTAGTVAGYRKFRAVYKSWPEARRQVAEARSAELAQAWKDATTATTVKGYREFRIAYALWPEATALVTRAYKVEVALAWTNAQQSGTWQAYLDFASQYPRDQRAEGAERAHYRLRRKSETGSTWPRAAIQHRRVLPTGEIELHVDVRDCVGRRINGLTRGQFDVMINGAATRITGFRGLEDDRPLDIVFGLDLSGSMSTEREAVRVAVLRFAETFRFRGRRARLGLIGFSDEVMASHRPSPRPADFRQWMAKLPGTGGGSGEDGAHAMAKGAVMPLARGAERVFIMITDESLQMNQGGRAALKLGDGTTAVCTRLAKISKCFGRCKTPGCRCRCYMMLGRHEAQAMRRCLRRRGARRCQAGIPYHRYLQSAVRCGQPITDGSPAMDKLIKLLRKQRMRVFFIIPRMDGRQPITGFDALARGLFGRILYVPQDSTSPQDYVRPLMDIADQLSKQYVIRIDPGSPAPLYPSAPAAGKAGPSGAKAVARAVSLVRGATIQVGVRRMHVWNSLGAVQTGHVIRLLPIKGGKPSCPAFLVITPQRKLATTSACGDRFKAVPLPGGGTVVSASAVSKGVLVITSTGRLLLVSTTGTPPRKLEAGMVKVRATAVSLKGVMAVVGQDRAGKWKVAIRGAGGTALDEANDAPVAPGQTAPPPVLFTGRPGMDERVCLLLTHALMKCSADHGVTWLDHPMSGLPATVFEAPVERHTGSGLPRVHLLAASDGAVYRTMDGSFRWKLSLPASTAARRLVAVPGLRAGICVWSEGKLTCSDDMGLRWFAVGHSTTGKGHHVITTHGHELFVAGGGRFFRMDRVANREMASSSIYFNTNSDAPQAALLPFLKQVAVTMRTDLTAFLRVEGHADQRGSKVYNEDLAKRRAHKVAGRVASYGVKRKRIMILSFGERRPLSRGTSSTALARNRRVEILLMRRIPREGWTLDICSQQGGGGSGAWEQRRQAAEQAMRELERRKAPAAIKRMRKKVQAITRQCVPVKAGLRRVQLELRRTPDISTKLKIAVRRDALINKLKALRRRLDGLHMTAMVRAGLNSEIAALKVQCSR